MHVVQESQKECAKLRLQILERDSHAGTMQQALTDLQEEQRQADQVSHVSELCDLQYHVPSLSDSTCQCIHH